MNIELTPKEFRRLLDMVYIGNWVLNSTRGEDRFEDYDLLQEKMFSYCAKNGMKDLYQTWYGHVFPSKAFEEGGIHEAIADYEDAVFFDILAEELARRVPFDTALRVLHAPTAAYPCKDGRAAYYVCRGNACLPPVNTLSEALQLIGQRP